MKRIVSFLLWMGLTLPMMAAPAAPAAVEKPFTVVIDAGHGGKDAGAVGRKYYEKNLNLDVSLLVGKQIAHDYPEVKVVYTRTTDVFLPLQQRADIVNKNNADLFICIHTNASESRTAKGAETFILGTEKMEQNLDVAMRENAVIKLEADYQTAYQGFDPNSIESYIMFDLMQNQYMDQSLRFATYVQQQFVGTLKRDDRGVRQAAFWVLLKSACPSVLVEMGFISNAEEEQYLGSTNGKKQIATAIVDAFRAFYGKPTPNNPEPQPTTPEQPQVTTPEQPQVTTPEPQPTTPEPQPTTPDQPRFAVQIFVSSSVLPKNDHNFRGRKDAKYFEANGRYKYYIGAYDTQAQAADAMRELRKLFPDCFVIKLNK